MLKPSVILLMILLLLCKFLLSNEIIEITEISHNQKIVDYSQWNGAIRSYDNRLFVENPASFHEFVVSENNEIERVVQLDTRRRSLNFLVSENRLYKFYSDNITNRQYYMMIFDLASTPMEHIHTMEIPYIQHGGYISSAHLNGDYIYFNNGTSFTSKLNRHILTFEEPLNGLYGNIDFKDNIVVQRIDLNQGIGQPLDHRLRFYDYTLADEQNPFGLLKAEIMFSEIYNGQAPGIMEIIEGKLISMSWDFFVVFDITDLDHITELFHHYTNTSNEICFTKGIFVNDCFIAAHTDGIQLFDISDTQNIIFVHEESYNLSGSRHSIEHYNGILYLNATDYLVIYDISNNFEQISTYGNNLSRYKLVDHYLLENLDTSSFMQLFSMVDLTSEVYNINTGYDPGIYNVKDFKVIDDHLYIITSVNDTNIFQIYLLPNTVLVYQIELNINPSYFQIYGNLIIFIEAPLSGSDNNYIYETIGYSLSYFGEFTDNISRLSGYTDDEYIISYANNTLNFRDILNPSSIINSYIIPHDLSTRVYDIKKNVICFDVASNYSYYFYSYSNDVSNFHEFESFYYPGDNFRQLNFFNEYIAVNGHLGSTETVLYREHSERLCEIGRYELDGSTINSFIFPEQNKLIIQKNSSIHLYDIEYTTVSEQDDISTITNTRLLSNFPNPFNPETTINFTL